MSLLEKAIKLAVNAHTGQLDKTGQPYILHPLHLMLQMETEAAMITAVLHDVVEDTAVTMADLTKIGLSPSVLEAVRLLTHDKDNVSYLDYIAAINENPLARQVKLADLAHNMDIRRLPAPLTAKDHTRLNRYRQAWQQLN